MEVHYMSSQQSSFNADTQSILEAFDLVKELNDETAEVISGGQVGSVTSSLVSQDNIIKINNKTNLPVYLDLDFAGKRWQDFRLGSGQSYTFSSRGTGAIIDYDESYCIPGIQDRTYSLTASKQYNFRLGSDGCKLNLFDAGSIA